MPVGLRRKLLWVRGVSRDGASPAFNPPARFRAELRTENSDTPLPPFLLPLQFQLLLPLPPQVSQKVSACGRRPFGVRLGSSTEGQPSRHALPDKADHGVPQRLGQHPRLPGHRVFLVARGDVAHLDEPEVGPQRIHREPVPAGN